MIYCGKVSVCLYSIVANHVTINGHEWSNDGTRFTMYVRLSNQESIDLNNKERR